MHASLGTMIGNNNNYYVISDAVKSPAAAAFRTVIHKEVDFPKVLQVIRDVSDWRSLGTHLGIEAAKLQEISRYQPEDQKSKLVAAWFECDEECTWEKLREALEKPSVSGLQAVENVERIRRSSLITSTSYRGDSVDVDGPLSSSECKYTMQAFFTSQYTTSHYTSYLVDNSDNSILPFTEAHVLEAVVKVSKYYRELGIRLEIPPHKLTQIFENPPTDRHQMFVAALFENAPKEKCSWKAVNSAIKELEMREWATQPRADTMTKSSSIDSQLSSISVGGM